MRVREGLEEIKHRNKKNILSVFHLRFNAQAWACTLTAGSTVQVAVLRIIKTQSLKVRKDL